MHDFDDCDHLHLKGIHTFYETGNADQRSREHSLDVVKEWIDINSHDFTIPGDDWGQHLIASLHHVIAMAEHYAGTNNRP